MLRARDLAALRLRSTIACCLFRIFGVSGETFAGVSPILLDSPVIVCPHGSVSAQAVALLQFNESGRDVLGVPLHRETAKSPQRESDAG